MVKIEQKIKTAPVFCFMIALTLEVINTEMLAQAKIQKRQLESWLESGDFSNFPAADLQEMELENAE